MPENMPGKGIGHFFGAMRVDAFRPKEEFFKDMEQWITRFRNAKPIPGEEKVLIPGDPERSYEAIRRVEGIPLLRPVVEDLSALAQKFGCKL